MIMHDPRTEEGQLKQTRSKVKCPGWQWEKIVRFLGGYAYGDERYQKRTEQLPGVTNPIPALAVPSTAPGYDEEGIDAPAKCE